MKSQCRHCHAEIEWALFDRSRKPVALDLGVFEKGVLVVVGRRGDHATPVVRFTTLLEREIVEEAGQGFRRAHEHARGNGSL